MDINFTHHVHGEKVRRFISEHFLAKKQDSGLLLLRCCCCRWCINAYSHSSVFQNLPSKCQNVGQERLLHAQSQAQLEENEFKLKK